MIQVRKKIVATDESPKTLKSFTRNRLRNFQPDQLLNLGLYIIHGNRVGFGLFSERYMFYIFKMKKILITGASGFLGWNCCKKALGRFNVAGLYRFRNIQIPGVKMYQCDISDIHQTEKVLSEISPEIVIHTAANSSPNECEEKPELSWLVNVESSINLALQCERRQIPFVFTSTDLVFDGESAPYSELDVPSPVNEYGRQKFEAEKSVISYCQGAIVCRMPLMYGDSPEGATSFIKPWLEKLRKGESLSLFIDEFRTPVSASSAAEGLLLAAETLQGIIHLGGKERLSRYEMGKKLVKCAGLDPSLIKACSQNDVLMVAKRPKDVSLTSAIAMSVGYNPATFEEELSLLNIARSS